MEWDSLGYDLPQHGDQCEWHPEKHTIKIKLIGTRVVERKVYT